MPDNQPKSQPIPFGRRSPRGRKRWYLAHVPKGQEASTAAKLKKLIADDFLDDAFVVSRDKWIKRNGTWILEAEPLYHEYAFIESRDATGLSRALSKLSFHVELAGAGDETFAPIDSDVQNWFAATMDRTYAVRGSVAEIEDGRLTVLSGPLVGQENRIVKIDRHKRSCLVRVSERNGGFTERFALNVPAKN